MKKLMILALAPLAMLTAPASAQHSAMQRSTTTVHPNGTTVTNTVVRDRNTYGNNRVVQHTVTRTGDRGWNGTRTWSRSGHGMRHCFTTWRHHHKVRTCTTRHRG
jgi:hypothetical protein